MRIGIVVVGWILFETIFYPIIVYVFGHGAGLGATFIAAIAGLLFVLFGGIFDDSNGPPRSGDDNWREDYWRRRGEAAWQNQMRGKNK